MGSGPGPDGGFGPGMHGGGMEAFGHHGGGGSDWASWLAIPTLVFVIIAVALAAWSAYMIWKMTRERGAVGGSSEAEAVLAARLANGEIGADDYTRRIGVLRGGTGRPSSTD